MKSILMTAIVLCMFGVACTKKQEEAPKKEEPVNVVLELGTLKLTDTDINAMFTNLPLEQKNRYLTQGPNALQAFVNDLAEKQLLIQAAKDQKYPDKQSVHATLMMAENSILYGAFYRSEVLDKVIPESELRTFFEAHKERFFSPEQLRVRHILVTPRAGGTINNTSGDDAKTEADAKKKITRLSEQLKAGAKFEDMARQFSEDPSAADGGLMDWFTRGRTVKAFEDAAFSLTAPGQISEPVKSDFGYHLIQLLERKERHYFSFEDVRNEIQNQLASQRAADIEKAYQKLVQDLKTRYPEKINMENLK